MLLLHIPPTSKTWNEKSLLFTITKHETIPKSIQQPVLFVDLEELPTLGPHALAQFPHHIRYAIVLLLCVRALGGSERPKTMY